MKKCAAGLLVLFVLICCTCAANAADVDADEMLAEELPNVALPGWGGFEIPSGTTEVDMYMNNPCRNQDWYNLTFEVWAAIPEDQIAEDAETQIVQESDENGNINETLYVMLYRSEQVKPGEGIEHIALTQPLSAGRYKMFVHMQPYFIMNGLPVPNNGNLFIYLDVLDTAQ